MPPSSQSQLVRFAASQVGKAGDSSKSLPSAEIVEPSHLALSIKQTDGSLERIPEIGRPEVSMRRTFGILIFVLLLSAEGCTYAQLRTTTLNQGSTLAEIQYQMILRNLATFADNPSAIPWHVSVTTGTSQVADAGTGHIGLLWDLPRITANQVFQPNPTASASRTIVQQWTTNPIVHTDALRLLQLAYRKAYGSVEMPDAKLLDDLAHDIKKQVLSTEDLRTETLFFYQSQYAKLEKSYDALRRKTSSTVGEQSVIPAGEGPDPLVDMRSPLAREVAREVNDIVEDLREVPTGWFGVGGKHDVPKNACFVAHEGKVYVWVTPDRRGDLSKFTMTILDIATAVQEPETLTVQGGGLSFSPGFTAPP